MSDLSPNTNIPSNEPPLTVDENRAVPSATAADAAPGAEQEDARRQPQDTPEPRAEAPAEDAGRPSQYSRKDMLEHIAANREKDRLSNAHAIPDIADQLDPAAQIGGRDEREPTAADGEPAPLPEFPRPQQDGDHLEVVMPTGVRVLVPRANVADALARGLDAERRLHEMQSNPNARPVAQQPEPDAGTIATQAEEDSLSDEERRGIIRAIQMGTEEEAAEAFKMFEARRPKGADPNEVRRVVAATFEEAGRDAALVRLQTVYPEIFNDQGYAIQVGVAYNNLIQSRGGQHPKNAREYEALMQTVVDGVHSKYVEPGKTRLSLRGGQTAANQTAPTPMTARSGVTIAPHVLETRREVKRNQPSPPTASQAATFAPPPARESRSDVIRNARKARGQVV
jgi:hypothetical protein